MKLTKIPRNLFQTWSTKQISNNFNILSQTWREQNPHYAYFLYDDEDCEKFIKKILMKMYIMHMSRSYREHSKQTYGDIVYCIFMAVYM